MKFGHNIKYFCMIRDLFENMSVELVNKFDNYDNYMISISNPRIREIFSKAGINYNVFENLIQSIAQKLFEEGVYYLNVVIDKNQKGEIENIKFCTKSSANSEENVKIHKFKIRNDFKIWNCLRRKRLLHKFSKMNEFEIKDYKSSNELAYFSEKDKKDKYDFLKITKNMYIQGDTPEEITTYYHNYRVIKTRIWQVKYVQHIINKLNIFFEDIFKEKNIIVYNGISIEELKKYIEKLKENEISMSELSIKLMKVEKI